MCECNGKIQFNTVKIKGAIKIFSCQFKFQIFFLCSFFLKKLQNMVFNKVKTLRDSKISIQNYTSKREVRRAVTVVVDC